MHAGALGYRRDLTPEETATAAAVIQDNAHRALADLREILGVLRSGSEGEATPEQPQPTLADLDALVEDERRAGAKVRLRTGFGEPNEVPDFVGRNAYRIVQESLTNARKHAPGTAVDVVVAGRPGRYLAVQVRNPLPIGDVRRAPGARLGMVGLAERAALAGGTLDHRIRRGQFVVQARLPWPS
jgi:signal transduction histidine kinase